MRTVLVAAAMIAASPTYAQYLPGGMIDRAIRQQPVSDAQQAAIDMYAAATYAQRQCKYKINTALLNRLTAQAGVDFRIQLHKYTLDNASLSYEARFNNKKQAFCQAILLDMGPNGGPASGVLSR
jgi:hypothetical protein